MLACVSLSGIGRGLTSAGRSTAVTKVTPQLLHTWRVNVRNSNQTLVSVDWHAEQATFCDGVSQ